MIFNLWPARHQTALLFAHSVDNVEAESLQFFIVKVVNAVHFLQAEQTCRTCSDFFDYARSAELKVEYLFRCIGEPVRTAELVRENIVAHDMNLTPFNS